jgi:hypothetical protein
VQDSAAAPSADVVTFTKHIETVRATRGEVSNAYLRSERMQKRRVD